MDDEKKSFLLLFKTLLAILENTQGVPGSRGYWKLQKELDEFIKKNEKIL